MIRGYFFATVSTRLPVFDAFMTINSSGIHIHQAKIPLLLDTGADRTTLSPGGSYLLHINPFRLTSTGTHTGVGGQMKIAEVDAYVEFEDTRLGFVGYNRKVSIAIPPDPNKINMRTPSLLGTDIVQDWRIIYDPTHGQNGRLLAKAMNPNGIRP